MRGWGWKGMAREIVPKAGDELGQSQAYILIERLDDVGNGFSGHWLVMRIRTGPNDLARFGVEEFEFE